MIVKNGLNKIYNILYKHGIYLVLLLSIILRIFDLIIPNKSLFWDGAVYLEMGKYIFSTGKLGLIEIFRPPLYPLMLGLPWKLNLNPIIIGTIITFVLSIASIYLIFLIVKKIANKKMGIIAALLFALSPTHIFYSTKILNDNISTFLILLTIYFFIKNKNYFWIGILCGLSFLTRFTNGLLLIIPISYIFMKFLKYKEFKIKIKKILLLGIGFLIITAPYFLIIQKQYGDFTLPLRAGSLIIKKVGESISQNTNYYSEGLKSETPLFLVSIISIFIILLQINRNKKNEKNLKLISIYIFTLIVFIYHTHLARKEMRYMLMIIPLVILLGIYTISKIKIINKNRILNLIIIIIITILSYNKMNIELTNYENEFLTKEPTELINNYYNADLKGSVGIFNPKIAAYQDIKPVYYLGGVNEELLMNFDNQNITTFIFSNCDIYCAEFNIDCQNRTRDLMQQLNSQYDLEYNKTYNWCEYYIFEKN